MNIAAPMSAPSMRHLARVVGDEQHAPGRDVLDAVHLGAEVLAVEHRHGRERVLGPLRVEAEGIDARRAERHAGRARCGRRSARRAAARGRRRSTARRSRRGARSRPGAPRAAASMRASAREGEVGVDHGRSHYGRRVAAFNELCSCRAMMRPAVRRSRREIWWPSWRRRARFRARSSCAGWRGCGLRYRLRIRRRDASRATGTSPGATRGGRGARAARWAIRR